MHPGGVPRPRWGPFPEPEEQSRLNYPLGEHTSLYAHMDVRSYGM